MATATGAKPNVIVVQKAQPKKGGAAAAAGTASLSVVTKGPAGTQSGFEKVRPARRLCDVWRK